MAITDAAFTVRQASSVIGKGRPSCCIGKYNQCVEAHQHGTTLQVNVLHHPLVQVDGLELPVIEASQAISDAKDLVRGHAIIL